MYRSLYHTQLSYNLDISPTERQVSYCTSLVLPSSQIDSIPQSLPHLRLFFSAHRRVLSGHLLGKTSKIAWVASSILLVHETPNIFYNLLALFKLSPAQSTGFQANTWSAKLGDQKTNGMTAASLGAAAWMRERGGQTGPVTSGRPRIG